MRFKGIFASSADPAQLSTTLESLSKVLIGLIGWFAISKGLDPMTAQNQLQAILDLVAQGVPMVFTFWHSMMTAWGLIRKLLVYLGKDHTTV